MIAHTSRPRCLIEPRLIPEPCIYKQNLRWCLIDNWKVKLVRYFWWVRWQIRLFRSLTSHRYLSRCALNALCFHPFGFSSTNQISEGLWSAALAFGRSWLAAEARIISYRDDPFLGLSQHIKCRRKLLWRFKGLKKALLTDFRLQVNTTESFLTRGKKKKKHVEWTYNLLTNVALNVHRTF